MNNKLRTNGGDRDKYEYKHHEVMNDRNDTMNSLVAWNISKLLESKPNVDLKAEITAMQELLETKSWDVSTVVSHCPEDRYLACALLAWQQLGHGDANSLYQFIQSKLKTTGENESNSNVAKGIYIVSTSEISFKPDIFIKHKESIFSDSSNSFNLDTRSDFGPVVKLPVDTKIVMRCENTNRPRLPTKKCQITQHGEVEKKINAVCHMESPCNQRLLEMDRTTSALKKRVERLAKRECDRMKLLIRAEAAWKDLEQGYLTRLSTAEEKEEELARRIKNIISERSNYKNACTELAKQMQEKESTVGKVREDLKRIDVDVCDRARKKFRLSEEVTCADASLAQQHCRSAQYDRDLRSKEEQARRKLVILQNEVESSRVLRHEAERALRAELGALKDQVAKVSKRLLTEETETKTVKTELDEIRLKKSNIIEDLDTCKSMCDRNMRDKLLELRTKTEKLAEIKEKILECRCKQPRDGGVEAKRTPSLAAICRCTSDDILQGVCSCRSLRSSLLSNLLRDLFEGLQSELGENGSVMPCELLKCLEDKHNWERSSTVKSNLRSFFAKMLVEELNIAIATSIEKYHAKWVGESCVDEAARNRSDTEKDERAMEHRAQELAKQLAEQLFQEKAEQLMEKAKGLIKSSPPPCECDNIQPAATTYSCILKTNMPKSKQNYKTRETISPILKENTVKNMTQLHVQVPSQKAKAIKKSTLKSTKERTNKKITSAVFPDNVSILKENKRVKNWMTVNQFLHNRAVSTDKYEIEPDILINSSNKKNMEYDKPTAMLRNCNVSQNVPKNPRSKDLKGLAQSYAVNLCLYEPQKDSDQKISLLNNALPKDCVQDKKEVHNIHNPKVNLSPFENMSLYSVEIEKPISQPLENLKNEDTFICSKNCLCFNKLPSTHSVDNFLKIYCEEEFTSSSRLGGKMNDITYHDKNRIKFSFDSFGANCKNKNIRRRTQQIRMNNIDGSIFADINSNIFDDFNMCQENKESAQAHTMDENKFICKEVEEVFDNKRANMPFQNNISLKGQDVVCPTRDQSCKYTSTERNVGKNMKTSVQSFYIEREPNNYDLIANSVVDTSEVPVNSTFQVEFLGVTLNTNQNKNSVDDSISKSFKEGTYEDTVPINCDANEDKQNFSIIKNKMDQQSDIKTVYDELRKRYEQNYSLLDTKNNCICCNQDDGNYDLELNTFNLLLEYLQEKFDEFKSSTSRLSNIQPYQADLFFNDVLKKIKKMILESSNDITHNCSNPNKSDGIDARWRRACGLLQEYLRTKIKRFECSYSVEVSSCKSLPKIMDKVCQLIENDFERLRKMYVSTNTLKTSNNILKELNSKSNKININPNVTNSTHNLNDSKLLLKKTSFIKETLNPNLVTEKPDITNQKKITLPTMETLCKYNSCHMGDSDYDENKTVSNQIKVNNSCTNLKSIENLSILYIDKIVNFKCKQKRVPLCCAKSILKTNDDDFIQKVWPVEANKCPSNITLNLPNKHTGMEYRLQQKYKKGCEKNIEIFANNEEIELIESKCDLQKGRNNSTNTSRQKLYDNTDYISQDEWNDCESVQFSQNIDEITMYKEKIYKTLQLPLDNLENNMGKRILSSSDDALMCNIRSQNCECEMVPICHVKMLIDDIERKLLNSKCTCDELNSNVCPAHYEKVSY